MKKDIVVIGGSAGSLEALRVLVAGFPADFSAPIFVVMHMAAGARSVLPEILSSAGPLSALHPSNHEVFRPGVIYVAPPNAHLLVGPGFIALSRGPRENRHRPAIDTLFRSASRFYGSRVVGVVLSGRMDDGSAGLIAIKMRGGTAIVQDPKDAGSPEMPIRAIDYANPDYILPAAEIAEELVELTKEDLTPESSLSEIEVRKQRNQIDADTRPAHLDQETSDAKHGTPSEFACPDCHGVLWEIDEGGLLRFRCRVGHAYTADALRLAMSDASEDALWAAMGALEEKASLWRRMIPRSGDRMRTLFAEEAEQYERHAHEIRRMLLATQTIEEKKPEEAKIAEEAEIA